ncbi:MAG TPA: MarC family protein [Actinomycetota bacterium]|jgi:multiple antibiotic resistance protein|nr:MarC family protein [Actinomycetota bacterium]
MDLNAFGQTLVTLLVILDPLGNVPVFLALTGRMEPRQRNRAAYQAVGVATIVVLVFAIFGRLIIEFLSISLESLMVAGGVLLFIVALEMLRGAESLMSAAHADANVALVPLGTPLLAGPGTIVAAMVQMGRYPDAEGRIAVIAGLMGALVAVLAALRFAAAASHLVRPSAIHFMTRIMGLLLTAIAVQLVVGAVARWSEGGLP